REVLETCEVQDEVGRRGSGLVAFGSFTFDDCSEGSVLIVPRALLGRDTDGNAWFTTISASPGGRPPWTARNGGTARPPIPLWSPMPPRRPLTVPEGIRWHDGSLTAPEWEEAVAAAVRRITRGDLRKVVLARDLYASADGPIDARVLLRRLAARYPDCFTFA